MLDSMTTSDEQGWLLDGCLEGTLVSCIGVPVRPENPGPVAPAPVASGPGTLGPGSVQGTVLPCPVLGLMDALA
jgi:hypothetical protein